MCILSKCGKVKSTAPGSNLRMEGRKVKAQVAFLFFYIRCQWHLHTTISVFGYGDNGLGIGCHRPQGAMVCRPTPMPGGKCRTMWRCDARCHPDMRLYTERARTSPSGEACGLASDSVCPSQRVVNPSDASSWHL